MRFYKSLNEIKGHIEKVIQSVPEDTVNEIVDSILEAKRVFTYGAGRSGLVVKAFAQRLMHINIESYCIGETINPSVQPGNIVIIVSGSGETTSSVCIGKRAKEVGAKLIVITAHKESTLGRIADIVLQIPGKTKLVEDESYAPFTSLFDIATLAVLDSIAAEIMERAGIGEDTILKRHANVE